ncbi:transposase [Kitasatospora sp. NPDC091207]|uniref:transposase n=1 Tax=Kitasatospora sp. NPDC091207 TaxID=3364083 RepID=UPI00380257E7
MRADLVPDGLWERVAPLLPPAPEHRRRHPGRPRVPDRAALAGVMGVLRTGVAHGSGPGEARWMAERAFAWLRRLKRRRIRYERRADLHRGLLEPACGLICPCRLRTSW